MFHSKTDVRVRYAETDRMGFVYYGNYAAYFEVARVDALRSLGFSYLQLEDSGILLPVLDFSIHYIRPAYYDDVLQIRTRILELPAARIRFEYETFNVQDERLNQGQTSHAFLSRNTNKPCRAPSELVEKLKPFYLPAN